MLDKVPVTARHVIRFAVGLHAVALLLAPKDSFGLMAYRPEDVTAVLLLAVFGVLAMSGRLEVPSRALTQMTAAYFFYFLLVFAHDLAHGHAEALVFWFKEFSSVVFAYLLWRGYRDIPQTFLTGLVLISIPNIAFGIYQLFDTPRGIYGVAPLGHETSPASAGMIYLSCSIVMFMRSLSSRHTRWYGLLLFLSVVLVLASGSKVAVLGALCFYGWYLIQIAMEKRDAASIRRIGWFAVSAVVGIAIAVSAAGLGYSWRGLARYRGLLEPVQVLATRGIWWKIGWIDNPIGVVFGAGYSPAHLLPDNAYTFSMSMDNQVLYYLVTGGVLALALYVILMTLLYNVVAPAQPAGRVLRALVVSYCVMGLGAEVLQLSVHGNVFWMLVGLCLAMRPLPEAERVTVPSPRAIPRAATMRMATLSARVDP